MQLDHRVFKDQQEMMVQLAQQDHKDQLVLTVLFQAHKDHRAYKEFKDKLVLSDGSRNVEVHRIRGNGHADNLLMIYLPLEKLLIEPDAFTPPPPGATLAPQNVPLAANLVENIENLKLSVERIMPLHGPIVPLSQLYQAVGKAR